MNRKIKLSVGLCCLAVIMGAMLLAAFNPDFARWDRKPIASFFMGQGWQQLEATNTVCTIVWEYRGYDTLGEETILFTAAIGVFALGAGLFLAENAQNKQQGVKQ